MTKGRVIVVGLAVMIGAWVFAFCSGQNTERPSLGFQAAAARVTGCQPHIEVHNAAHWAKELGTTEAAAQTNHRINLWNRPSGRERAVVGYLLVGSRAVILDEMPDAYRVQSPADKSDGWLSKIQVARTLKQDVETRRPCD